MNNARLLCLGGSLASKCWRTDESLLSSVVRRFLDNSHDHLFRRRSSSLSPHDACIIKRTRDEQLGREERTDKDGPRTGVGDGASWCPDGRTTERRAGDLDLRVSRVELADETEPSRPLIAPSAGARSVACENWFVWFSTRRRTPPCIRGTKTKHELMQQTRRPLNCNSVTILEGTQRVQTSANTAT